MSGTCPIDLSILGRRIKTEILVDERKDLIRLGRHDVSRSFQLGFDERAETMLVEPYSELAVWLCSRGFHKLRP